jgi:hypothetical protein
MQICPSFPRWDEIGRYDIPACINYVLRKTGSRKLTYIGHSMGTEYFDKQFLYATFILPKKKVNQQINPGIKLF